MLCFPEFFAGRFGASCRSGDRMQLFGVGVLFERETFSATLSSQLMVSPQKPGCPETSLTLSFSCLLLLGPFHWTMVFPMSSRNTSPQLKLFQLISTCKTSQNRATNWPRSEASWAVTALTSLAVTLFLPLTWSSLFTS